MNFNGSSSFYPSAVYVSILINITITTIPYPGLLRFELSKHQPKYQIAISPNWS